MITAVKVGPKKKAVTASVSNGSHVTRIGRELTEELGLPIEKLSSSMHVVNIIGGKERVYGYIPSLEITTGSYRLKIDALVCDVNIDPVRMILGADWCRRAVEIMTNRELVLLDGSRHPVGSFPSDTAFIPTSFLPKEFPPIKCSACDRVLYGMLKCALCLQEP
jgi:hypothetical protein